MKKEYKLNIDPRILELLGPNLYTNIYYVLAELIANAFDADATDVYIIANANEIRIEDNGNGMSYENGEVNKYLNIAGLSRTDEENSYTPIFKRRKMGRKGIGKLAALSVSANINVMTMTETGEKSGFILSRTPKNNGILEEIPDSKINFLYIQKKGTAIVMQNPKYKLSESIDTIRRNLLKIFPMVNNNFCIHIVKENHITDIRDFDIAIMKELCAIITLGEDFKYLSEMVEDTFPNRKDELKENRKQYEEKLELTNSFGELKEYQFVLKGWIGTYKTTRGRKSSLVDFPDNFISVFANKKLGEFNILPLVGQNKSLTTTKGGGLKCEPLKAVKPCG